TKRMMVMTSLLIAMEVNLSNHGYDMFNIDVFISFIMKKADVLKIVDGYSGINAYDVWNGYGLMVDAKEVRSQIKNLSTGSRRIGSMLVYA
nr:hypothetical protein [Tanacetum cinerariifolium]